MILTLHIGAILYFVVVIYIAKKFVAQNIAWKEEETLVLERRFEDLIASKEKLDNKKIELENKATEALTLYEITKDITQSLNEEEAFLIFKEKLKNYLRFDECYLLHSSKEIQALKDRSGQVHFPLRWKAEELGTLFLSGVSKEEEGTIKILGQQFALVLRRVKLYHRIERIAITDSLTQVYTRHYAWERLDEELKRSKERKIKLSLIMIDVDFFKKFNDSYGHLVGDQILKAIAGVIKESIREIDIAGRFGGEEFFVILPDTDQKGAELAAERIRQATEKTTIKAYDAHIKATVSLGLATFPEDGEESQFLIDKADWALYRAKKNGRNRVCAFGVYKKST